MSHSLIKDTGFGVGRDFLLYWRPDSVDDNRDHQPLLLHAGSNQLHRVSVGDTVWISTVRDGGLFVAGRLKVGECTDWEGAKERLDTDDVWEARFHVIAADGTAESMSNLSMAHVVSEMRFEGANDRFVLRDGKIDAGQLQPMRELAPSSAGLLNSLWTQYRAGGEGQKTHQGNGGLWKYTDNNGKTNQPLSAEIILEALGDELDLVRDATRTPWIAYLSPEAYRVLKESDPDLFYINEGHEYLRVWENVTIPFIIHMRVEIDDSIPNIPPDYGCRREVDSDVDPATVGQNIAAFFKQVSLENPGDSLTLYNLGVVLGDAGRPQEAIQAYLRVLTLDPKYPAAHYNLGATYFDVGEFQLAIEQLEDETRLAPEFAEAHFMLGSALIELGRLSLGIEATKRGLEFSPDDPGAHFNIGHAFKELGDYEAAIPWLEKTVTLSPDSALAYYEMGRVYRELGRLEDEFRFYLNAIEIQEDFIPALFALGTAYDRLKRGDEARVPSKEPPRDLDLQDGETVYYLALSYLAVGHTDVARVWQRSLRDIDPQLANELEPYVVEREQDAESETAPRESPSRVIELPITAIVASRKRLPIRVRIGGQQFEAPTIPKLYRAALKFLCVGGYIAKLSLPVASGPKRYLLSTSPQHRGGNPFVSPVEYGGYYMEAHKSRSGALADLERLVTLCGLTFEKDGAYNLVGGDPIAIDHVTDLISAESRDPAEDSEQINNRVESEKEEDVRGQDQETMTEEEFQWAAKIKGDPRATAEERQKMIEMFETKNLPKGVEEVFSELAFDIDPDWDDDAYEAAKEALAKAQRVFVLTGAGVSAESGVPTFRSGGGATVWRGIPFEELSSARMVQDNLPLVWEWFDYRRGVVADCHPNAGHQALAACELSGRFDEFTLVTQNVDGLHATAGSTAIIELHGNIWRARCLTCHALREMRDVPTDERPPVCIECGDLMRPDVVLFGENLPEGVFENAQGYAENCDVFLVIGTSALVSPAANLPVAALQAGKFVIEINPEPTAFSRRCNVSLRGLAGRILPQLLLCDGRELAPENRW